MGVVCGCVREYKLTGSVLPPKGIKTLQLEVISGDDHTLVTSFTYHETGLLVKRFCTEEEEEEADESSSGSLSFYGPREGERETEHSGRSISIACVKLLRTERV